jgi:hypothetical protein
MPPIVVVEEEVAVEMAISVVGAEGVVAEVVATRLRARSLGRPGTLPCAATSILTLITMVKRNRHTL